MGESQSDTCQIRSRSGSPKEELPGEVGSKNAHPAEDAFEATVRAVRDICRFTQLQQSGNGKPWMLPNLHPVAAMRVQHPLGNKHLIAAAHPLRESADYLAAFLRYSTLPFLRAGRWNQADFVGNQPQSAVTNIAKFTDEASARRARRKIPGKFLARVFTGKTAIPQPSFSSSQSI